MPALVTTPNNPPVSYGTDWSRLHVAVRNHKHGDTRQLIQTEPALLDKPLNNGWTALMIAVEMGCTEAVSDLIKAGANKEAKTHGSGRTALMIAADLGHAVVVDLLLNAGANKEAKSKTGQTACERAALRNHHNVVSLFKSAQVTQALDYSVNPQGYNALHLAVRDNQVFEVKRLIKAGYDISRSGPNGWTALMLAAEQGYDEIVTLLLEAGAEKEARNRDGYTPLMIAAAHGRVSSVKILLEAGANRQAVTREGINARRRAALRRDELEEIQSRQGTSSTEDIWQRLRLQAVVKVFVDDEADRTVLNVNGRNGLHEAVVSQDMVAMKRWLAMGLPVNKPDQDGHSALLLAVEQGYMEAVNMLLDAGADKEAETSSKMTPLLLAVSKGHTGIVRLLLMAGVNLAATNLAKETAIDIAQRLGHTNMLDLLTQAETDKKTAWLGEPKQIYQEKTGPRAERLDYAWKIYQQEPTETVYKQNARAFLLHLFDMDASTTEIEAELAACMAERNQHKFENPYYIPRKLPKRVRDRWQLSPAQLSHLDKTRPDIAYLWSEGHVLQRNADAISKDKDYGTRSLSRWEQAPYQVGIHAKLFKHNGVVVDTTASEAHGRKGFAAVIWKVKDGEILLFNHKRMADGLAHSSMLDSEEPLLFSGEIKIVQGRLKAITLHSGHYLPTLEHARHFIKHLARQGVDVSEAEILTFRGVSPQLPHIRSVGRQDNFFFRLPATDVLKKPEGLCKPTPLQLPSAPTLSLPVAPEKPKLKPPSQPAMPQLSKPTPPEAKNTTHVNTAFNTIRDELTQYKNSWWTRLLLLCGNQLTTKRVALADSFSQYQLPEGEVKTQITALEGEIQRLNGVNNTYSMDPNHKKAQDSGRLAAKLQTSLKTLKLLTDFVKADEVFQKAQQAYDQQQRTYQQEMRSYQPLQAAYDAEQLDYQQQCRVYNVALNQYQQAQQTYQAAVTAAQQPMKGYKEAKEVYYESLRTMR